MEFELYSEKPHIVEVTDATKWWGREPGSEYYKKHEGNLVVKVKCRVLGTPHLIELKADDWIRWKELGQHAQDVFHYLKPSDRELLISGTSDEAWSRIFGDEMSEEEVAEQARSVACLHLRKEEEPFN